MLIVVIQQGAVIINSSILMNIKENLKSVCVQWGSKSLVCKHECNQL